MKIVSTFKHLEHTPALDEKIERKSQKLKKYFDGNLEVQWTCYVKDESQWADIKLLGPNFEYHASAHSEKLYKTLDLAINKIEKQIVKRKDKWRNKISNKHASSVKGQQIAEGQKDEQYWEDRNLDDEVQAS